MREESRGVGVGAAAHVVDRGVFDPGVEQLQTNEPREIAMRLRPASVDYRATPGGPFHLQRHLLAHLEGGNPNVGADSGYQRRWGVGQRPDRMRQDARYGATPSSMDRRNRTGFSVTDQNRDAVRSTSRDSSPRSSGDQRIPLGIGDGGRFVDATDLPNVHPVNLPLLVESIERDAEPLCEARAIFTNRSDIVAEVKAEVKRVVRRTAHTARARRKEVSKPVPIQKGGMEAAHGVSCSTPTRRIVDAPTCTFDQCCYRAGP